MRSTFILFAAALLALTFSPSRARADWEIVPNSHELYETYGLFIDNQTTLVAYGESRYWGGIGGTFALVGNPDTPAHPQFVIIASVYAAMISPVPVASIRTRSTCARGEPRVRAQPHDAAFARLRCTTRATSPTASSIRTCSTSTTTWATTCCLPALFTTWVLRRARARRSCPSSTAARTWSFSAPTSSPSTFPGAETAAPETLTLCRRGPPAGRHQPVRDRQHAQCPDRRVLRQSLQQWVQPTLRPVLGFYTGADPRLKYFQFENKTATF